MFAVTFEERQLEGFLHIPEPRYIDRASFSLDLKQLDVYVKFREGALFSCSNCGATLQPVKDIADRDPCECCEKTFDRGFRDAKVSLDPTYYLEEISVKKVMDLMGSLVVGCPGFAALPIAISITGT